MLHRPVMSDSVQPHGLQPTLQPARLRCKWDFPGKNTGVGFSSFRKPSQPRVKPASPMSPGLAGRFVTAETPEKPQGGPVRLPVWNPGRRTPDGPGSPTFS